MASSKERILAYERTLQVTNNFSKFVDKSEVPCAAILSSAIDFASALLKRTYHLEDKYKLLMKEYYQKLKESIWVNASGGRIRERYAQSCRSDMEDKDSLHCQRLVLLVQ